MMAYWWGVFLLVWPTVGVFLVTRSLTQAEERDAKQELAERVSRLEALRKADREMLGRYQWIDRGKGVVALPIERAMELEEERLKSKEVGPSKVLLPGALLRQPPSSAPKP
ncbi:hypothetical protein [Methylacidimicrobium sp. B4]|uniref:hypothetical protein n=1 Tax=Methylacidimicrobium sp. B4 TaxID=2796139 RepID=UPI001A908FCE|nr:hypothetical protein [Methylacidimicrobium sp. B4]QSR85709.1 hypothetical protein MacB4_05710 [Methylacidimicrobium sp. B4]